MSLVALVTGAKAAPAVSPAPTVTFRGPGPHDVDAAVAAWRREMQHLIELRRKDPHALHSVPFPVTYQELK
jgi:hypothetical protein